MRVMKITLASLAALYLGALAWLAIQQRAMVFKPRALLVTPAQAGLPDVETLRLKTEDGETLEAWHRAPRDPGAPLILYFHGNSGTLVDRKDRFDWLTRHGYGLLALSWRGYGGSTGAPSEDGLMRDAEAAYAEARRRGYPSARIVLMGESLGTGVATMLAARHEVAAVALDSPYDSVASLAEELYPIFPVGLFLLDPFHADAAIGKVRAPVLMVVGGRDPITPAASARRLFARANEPKRLIEIPEAGHIPMSSPATMEQAMEWIDGAVKSSPARDPSR